MKKLLILSILAVSIIPGENPGSGANPPSYGGIIASLYVSYYGIIYGYQGAKNLWMGKDAIQQKYDAKIKKINGQYVVACALSEYFKNDDTRINSVLIERKNQLATMVGAGNESFTAGYNQQKNIIETSESLGSYANKMLNKQATKYGNFKSAYLLEQERDFQNKYHYPLNITKAVGGFGITALWLYCAKLLWNAQKNK